MRSWLIEIRKHQNLLQKDVAKSAGISRQQYCSVENGIRRPSVDTAKKIAEVLGFDWTRFFEEEQSK